jgi:hypothetical protein
MLTFQWVKGAMTEDSHSMVRPLALAWLFFLITAIATAGACWGESMIDLHQYQWKNRLLLIFASHGDEPAYKTLKAEIEARAEGVEERDLLVGEVLERGQSYFAGGPIEPESADALRRRFSVSEQPFTVLLIGKDGELKMRREIPTALTEIFTLIDSMPMRRQEMRERK